VGGHFRPRLHVSTLPFVVDVPRLFVTSPIVTFVGNVSVSRKAKTAAGPIFVATTV